MSYYSNISDDLDYVMVDHDFKEDKFVQTLCEHQDKKYFIFNNNFSYKNFISYKKSKKRINLITYIFKILSAVFSFITIILLTIIFFNFYISESEDKKIEDNSSIYIVNLLTLIFASISFIFIILYAIFNYKNED